LGASSAACFAGGCSGGLYTIVDCRVGGEPFTARALHEVVHYWVQAAREVATLGEAALALALVRSWSVQNVLPWGRHPRSAVHQALDRLQAVWISDGDFEEAAVADVGGRSSSSLLHLPLGGEDGMLCALQAAERMLLEDWAPQTKAGRRLELWSFRPNDAVRVLRTTAAAEVLARLAARDVQVTLAALDWKRRGAGAAAVATAALGGGVGEEGETAELIHQTDESSGAPNVNVVTVAPSRHGVLRQVRRHLSMRLAAHLRLPLEVWQQDSLRDVRGVSKGRLTSVVRCACVPAVLLLPEQREAATALRSIVEFEFDRLVSSDGIEPYHVYGIPLVARPMVGGGTSALASRLLDRRECGGGGGGNGSREPFADLVRILALSDAAAVLTAKVSPLDLALSLDPHFFLAAPAGRRWGRATAAAAATVLDGLPLRPGQPRALVLQGLLCHDVASASMPHPPLGGSSWPDRFHGTGEEEEEDEEGAEEENKERSSGTGAQGEEAGAAGEDLLGFGRWALEDVYNPLKHCAEPRLVDEVANALPRRPSLAPPSLSSFACPRGAAAGEGGGCGRGRGRSSRAQARGTGGGQQESALLHAAAAPHPLQHIASARVAPAPAAVAPAVPRYIEPMAAMVAAPAALPPQPFPVPTAPPVTFGPIAIEPMLRQPMKRLRPAPPSASGAAAEGSGAAEGGGGGGGGPPPSLVPLQRQPSPPQDQAIITPGEAQSIRAGMFEFNF